MFLSRFIVFSFACEVIIILSSCGLPCYIKLVAHHIKLVAYHIKLAAYHIELVHQTSKVCTMGPFHNPAWFLSSIDHHKLFLSKFSASVLRDAALCARIHPIYHLITKSSLIDSLLVAYLNTWNLIMPLSDSEILTTFPEAMVPTSYISRPDLISKYSCRQAKSTNLVIMIWGPCTILSTFYCKNMKIRTQHFDFHEPNFQNWWNETMSPPKYWLDLKWTLKSWKIAQLTPFSILHLILEFGKIQMSHSHRKKWFYAT